MEEMSSVMSVAPDETVDGVGARFPESFSFAWLETLIDQHIQDRDRFIATKAERYAFLGMLFFGAFGLFGGLLLRNQLGLRVLQFGFAFQCLCIIVYLVSIGRQAWLGYLRQHKTFARDLDHQLVQYTVIVDAVRHYPDTVISTYLRYVLGRKSRLIYRSAFLSGGTEKLGILPLLLALYLQFKDWSFGGWRELINHVHLLGNFLLSMLAVTYLISWWAVRSKGRLDLYEIVLTEALARGDRAQSD